jgi:hypothetical protein
MENTGWKMKEWSRAVKVNPRCDKHHGPSSEARARPARRRANAFEEGMSYSCFCLRGVVENTEMCNSVTSRIHPRGIERVPPIVLNRVTEMANGVADCANMLGIAPDRGVNRSRRDFASLHT